MALLMIAGIAAVLAGSVAIWFGIPVKEFSFGNTMILAGAIAICNGLLLMGLGVVVRELKAVRLGLRERSVDAMSRETDEHLLPAGSIARQEGRLDRGEFDSRDGPSESVVPGSRRTAAVRKGESVASEPEAVRVDVESTKLSPDVAPPATPPTRARRNLLFSSSRNDREKVEGDAKSPVSTLPADLAPVIGTRTAQPHPSFNETWPRGERPPRADSAAPRRDAILSSPSRGDRISSSGQAAASTTVVKSGTVDGMAYSLYADGSIEAEMPEGMMRFASIDQLRVHVNRAR